MLLWPSSKRKRLVQEGLASEKSWRSLPQGNFLSIWEKSLSLRVIFSLALVIVLMLLGIWGNNDLKSAFFSAVLMGFTGFIGLVTTTLLFQEFSERQSRSVLFFSAILINLALVKLCLLYWPAQPGSLGDRPEAYALPTAVAPMLVTILLGYGPGMMSVGINSLLAAPLAPASGADVYQAIVLTSLLSGLAAVLFSQKIRKRTDILRAGFLIGIVSLINVITFALLYGQSFSVILWQSFLVVAFGIFTAFLVNAIIPLFESVFNITTDISWLEQSDLNHKLMRRLSIEAPGTYHHSLVMANLAETAAMAIGANALQCRVCAYFHDIGKLVKPLYFTENQGESANPHEDLSPTISTLVITSHIKEGVDLALKHKLNHHIIDAIREHHGTTVVKYFHHKAKRQHEDALTGVRILRLREDEMPDEPDEKDFRYDGPKPQSRETAILMLADGAEAIARSLAKPTPAKIQEAIDKLLHDRIEDGQFDECPISLKELRTVADTLTTTICSMLHNRINYPDDEKTKTKSNSDAEEKTTTDSLDKKSSETSSGANRTTKTTARVSLRKKATNS
jgi:putative nucleotidyltransferase with HDIG domain